MHWRKQRKPIVKLTNKTILAKGVIIALIATWFLTTYYIWQQIEIEGGIHGAIVEAGKEIKQIYREINQD